MYTAGHARKSDCKPTDCRALPFSSAQLAVMCRIRHVGYKVTFTRLFPGIVLEDGIASPSLDLHASNIPGPSTMRLRRDDGRLLRQVPTSGADRFRSSIPLRCAAGRSAVIGFAGLIDAFQRAYSAYRRTASAGMVVSLQDVFALYSNVQFANSLPSPVFYVDIIPNG